MAHRDAVRGHLELRPSPTASACVLRRVDDLTLYVRGLGATDNIPVIAITQFAPRTTIVVTSGCPGGSDRVIRRCRGPHSLARDRYDAIMDQALVERYRNHWVAVDDDGTVVAHDLSFEKLDEILSAMAPVHVVIRRIPAANEPLFVGVW